MHGWVTVKQTLLRNRLGTLLARGMRLSSSVWWLNSQTAAAARRAGRAADQRRCA